MIGYDDLVNVFHVFPVNGTVLEDLVAVRACGWRLL